MYLERKEGCWSVSAHTPLISYCVGVGALVYGFSSLGSSPGERVWFVFLGKVLNFHSASLQPGV